MGNDLRMFVDISDLASAIRMLGILDSSLAPIMKNAAYLVALRQGMRIVDNTPVDTGRLQADWRIYETATGAAIENRTYYGFWQVTGTRWFPPNQPFSDTIRNSPDEILRQAAGEVLAAVRVLTP